MSELRDMCCSVLGGGEEKMVNCEMICVRGELSCWPPHHILTPSASFFELVELN